MIFYGLFIIFKTAEVIFKNALVRFKSLEGWKNHPCLKCLFILWLVIDVCLVLVYAIIFCLGIYWASKAAINNNNNDNSSCSVIVKGSLVLLLGLIPVLIFFGVVLVCRYCYWPYRRRHAWIDITGQETHANYIDSLSCWYLACQCHHHHVDGMDGHHHSG